MAFIAPLAGLMDTAIVGTAAIATINVVGNAFKCSACGKTNENRQIIVRHIKTKHPRTMNRRRMSR